MKLDDMVIISVDDHVVEPANMFDQHIPLAQRELAPRLERDEHGADFWVYEDMRVPNIGLNAVAGRVPEEYGCEPQSLEQMRRGAWDVHARIGDMNVNGLLASLNFASFPGFDGALFLGAKDKNNALTVIKAYNDWHIDEWCAAYPGRFIPLAILPLWDPVLAAEEIRRVVTKGCRAISFPDNPAGRGLPSLHNECWEPIWKICAELGVTICCHIGTGSTPPHPSMESPIDAWIIGMPISISISAADWLHLKALHRYPDLKIALSEGGIGWVPYFLERADFSYHHHKAWTNADFGKRLPSEVFREHFITCFIDDKFGMKNRHEIGIETICYECDYPHSDSVWPHAPERLFENFVGMTDDEIDLVTHKNAMRFFHFDPFAILGQPNCTVGALRAQATNVDVTPVSFNAGRPVAAGTSRVVTSGDIVKLFKPIEADAA
ncbi:MAG: amidohydrolase family protein [Sphingorhabdus sp.]